MPQPLVEFLELGPATSREIQAATGLSQAGVSRQLRRLEQRIVKIQRGRSPRYILTKQAFGGSDRLPLSMVDASGNTVVVAYVRPLVDGGFYVESTAQTPAVLLGERGDGLYDDLPYFLYDLGPQGFLGRQIGAAMAAAHPDFPADPRRWTAHHVGRYLISNGDDLPGNFKFGDQALLRLRQKPAAVQDSAYPALAQSVMEGVIPGSSAGGEQPKFTAFSARSSAHVIVKFSPAGEHDVARRWKDILLTEYHAMQTLAANGIAAAETRLIEDGGRLFLESRRFDRIGEHGRTSMIALAAIDAEFVGKGSSWPRVFEALHQRGLLRPRQVVEAETLWCFGKLVHNTDMHLGNLSLAIDGNMFKLLPAYDMCSMGFAPRSGGEVLPYAFSPTHPERVALSDDGYRLVMEMAVNFWDSVASDDRISSQFKEFLATGNPMKKLA